MVGATNNKLYVSPDFMVPFSTVLNGRSYESRFRMAIPNGPAFAGVTFHAQGWYLDRSANPIGIVTTDALTLTTARASSTPVTNLIGHYDTTKTVGNFMYGTNLFGGPIVQFAGIFP